MDEVQKFFGFDSDSDLVVDNGLAYMVDNQTNPYVQTGGLIPLRISTVDTRLEDTNDRIASYERDLEDKEAELRRKYGIMEGTIQNLNDSSRALQNLGNTNSNQ